MLKGPDRPKLSYKRKKWYDTDFSVFESADFTDYIILKLKGVTATGPFFFGMKNKALKDLLA